MEVCERRDKRIGVLANQVTPNSSHYIFIGRMIPSNLYKKLGFLRIFPLTGCRTQDAGVVLDATSCLLRPSPGWMQRPSLFPSEIIWSQRLSGQCWVRWGLNEDDPLPKGSEVVTGHQPSTIYLPCVCPELTGRAGALTYFGPERGEKSYKHTQTQGLLLHHVFQIYPYCTPFYTARDKAVSCISSQTYLQHCSCSTPPSVICATYGEQDHRAYLGGKISHLSAKPSLSSASSLAPRRHEATRASTGGSVVGGNRGQESSD